IGARFTCTSKTDMKMLTCLVRPGQISLSGTSLICTTVPSAGESTSMCRSEPARCGSRKKFSRNRKTPTRIAPAIHHWIRNAAPARMMMGMMKIHPSGAKRTRGGIRWIKPETRNQKPEKAGGLTALPPFAFGFLVSGLRHGVLRLVRPDPRRHLILQMQLSLLQRLLFQLVVDGHVSLAGQLGQSGLTFVMLFDPLPKLVILTAENLLNIRGTVRHQIFPPSMYRFATANCKPLQSPPACFPGAPSRLPFLPWPSRP